MPLHYELDREDYVLIFELDKKHHWASIFIGAKSLSGIDFAVEGLPVGGCGGFDNRRSVNTVKYVWNPAFSLNCPVDDNEGYPSHQVIRFEVKDREGKTLGEEHLPFVLIRNGTYYEVDAL